MLMLPAHVEAKLTYAQIRERIKERVKSGVYKPDLFRNANLGKNLDARASDFVA